jgi:hypothetical protein
MRHVINRTLFEWSAQNQIAIWYPWQEKHGEPKRPLFSATYARENAMSNFAFESTEDFAAFCEEHAKSRPYLIETGADSETCQSCLRSSCGEKYMPSMAICTRCSQYHYEHPGEHGPACSNFTTEYFDGDEEEEEEEDE